MPQSVHKINKEFLLNGLTPPSTYKQIDLLLTARGRFRFPSNKLDFIAQALGVGKKHGHAGHELWVKCMAGDDEAWKVMEEYNKQDVNLLEKVYSIFLPWIKNHPNLGLFKGADVCPNCGSKHLQRRGKAYTAASSYQRFRCRDCGTWSRSRIADKETRPTIVSDRT